MIDSKQKTLCILLLRGRSRMFVNYMPVGMHILVASQEFSKKIKPGIPHLRASHLTNDPSSGMHRDSNDRICSSQV